LQICRDKLQQIAQILAESVPADILDGMDEKPGKPIDAWRPQISLRTLFELLAVAAFVLALVYARQPSPQPTPGRFVFELQPGRALHRALDTATGTIWTQQSDGTWHEAKGPLSP
jgi:hypothetical protein